MEKPSENRPSADSVSKELTAEAERIESQANTNAVSRVIAVMILMVIPGVVGSYLDKWLGTRFLIIVGFVLGIGFAIFGLLYVAQIADLAAKKSREMRKSAESSSHTNKTGSENDH